MKTLVLTNVDGFDVLVKRGPYLSSETELWIKNDDVELEISVPSNEYENDDHEFMLKRAIPYQLEKTVQKVIDTLSLEQVQLSYFTQMTVKPEFEKKINDWLE